jgi:protein-L-isoaspartate(D-aspartate) O-methyltransferase
MSLRDENTDRYTAARNHLLDSFMRPAVDGRVRSAIRQVPREEFVSPDLVSEAYKNVALPIGDGQTISQPLIVEEMSTALRTHAEDRVLEIGTGSGYQAAILSLLVADVITVERIPRLVDEARERLTRLGYKNVCVEDAGEQLGSPREAPFDRIIVTAGAPALPLRLLDQLVIGGRMVIPIGAIGKQELVLVTKSEIGHVVENLGACAFVPLIGRDAWPPEFD